jgi:hypothetical protein
MSIEVGARDDRPQVRPAASTATQTANTITVPHVRPSDRPAGGGSAMMHAERRPSHYELVQCPCGGETARRVMLLDFGHINVGQRLTSPTQHASVGATEAGAQPGALS